MNFLKISRVVVELLIFNKCINDNSKYVSKSKIQLFAVDNMIYFYEKNTKTVSEAL